MEQVNVGKRLDTLEVTADLQKAISRRQMWVNIRPQLVEQGRWRWHSLLENLTVQGRKEIG